MMKSFSRMSLWLGMMVITAVLALGLFTSARVAEQVRAGIQTLVSLSSPTGLALQWARRHNLNLIHLPQKSAPRVYSPAMENQP